MLATKIATVTVIETFYTRAAAPAVTIAASRIDGTLLQEMPFIHVKEAIVIATQLGHAATIELKMSGTSERGIVVETREVTTDPESTVMTGTGTETDTEGRIGMSLVWRVVSVEGGILSCLPILTKVTSRIGGRIIRLLKDF